jgi:hypothetical protein
MALVIEATSGHYETRDVEFKGLRVASGTRGNRARVIERGCSEMVTFTDFTPVCRGCGTDHAEDALGEGLAVERSGRCSASSLALRRGSRRRQAVLLKGLRSPARSGLRLSPSGRALLRVLFRGGLSEGKKWHGPATTATLRHQPTTCAVLRRSHLSPTIAAITAATITTGLMRFTTHPLYLAISGGSLRL